MNLSLKLWKKFCITRKTISNSFADISENVSFNNRSKELTNAVFSWDQHGIFRKLINFNMHLTSSLVILPFFNNSSSFCLYKVNISFVTSWFKCCRQIVSSRISSTSEQAFKCSIMWGTISLLTSGVKMSPFVLTATANRDRADRGILEVPRNGASFINLFLKLKHKHSIQLNFHSFKIRYKTQMLSSPSFIEFAVWHRSSCIVLWLESTPIFWRYSRLQVSSSKFILWIRDCCWLRNESNSSAGIVTLIVEPFSLDRMNDHKRIMNWVACCSLKRSPHSLYSWNNWNENNNIEVLRISLVTSHLQEGS